MKYSLAILTGFINLVFASQVYAVTATPSATPTDSSTPTPTQDLQEKIKTLVRENLNATESAVRDRINQKSLVGYVGNIKSISSDNLTLNIKENVLMQVTTDDKTEYIKSGTAIKFSSLAISDKTIIIGTTIKEEIILAKRIVVISETDSEELMISGTVAAKISSLDSKKRIIGLTVDGKETLYTLTKKSTVKIEELEEGETIFAITKKYQGKDYISKVKEI